MNKIGKLIKTLREERKISQQQLGDLLNCSKQTVCNYESGRRRPSYETLEAICDIFNVPRAFFFTEEEQRSQLQKLHNSLGHYISESVNESYSRSFSSNYSPTLSEKARSIAEIYDSLNSDGKELVDAAIHYASRYKVKSM